MNLTEAQKATETILAEVYKCRYEEGRCKGYNNRKIEEEFEDKSSDYEQGLNDAWECARKIAHSRPQEEWNDICRLFNVAEDKQHTIFEKYSASEAIAKIKEYEEKHKQADDEIKVGDEFKSNNSGRNCVVTRIDKNDVYTMWSDGSVGTRSIDYIRENFKKTGRHFPQISEALKQMDEEPTANNSDIAADNRLCMACKYGDLEMYEGPCEQCFFDKAKPNFERE